MSLISNTYMFVSSVWVKNSDLIKQHILITVYDFARFVFITTAKYVKI